MKPEGSYHGLALCAGACGLELGLSIALGDRYRSVCYVEREAYAAAVIVARMEDAGLDQAPIWDDVTTFDGRPWCGIVDIISAGYPCQPFSVAGSHRGVEDERWIWPDIRRIVAEVLPPVCFFENVDGHLRHGYFDIVRPDLEGLGYCVTEGLFTAAEVGAPHERCRLFVLAHAPNGRLGGNGGASGDAGHLNVGQPSVADAGERQFPITERGSGRRDGPRPASADVADVASVQLRGEPSTRPDAARRPGEGVIRCFPPGPTDSNGWVDWLQGFPDTEPSIRRNADGLAFRMDRLRLCGNGVVPLQAAYAFCTLAAKAGLGLAKGCAHGKTA